MACVPQVQLLSSLFMAQDLDMYDAEQDEPCLVNSQALMEELGQVRRHAHTIMAQTHTYTPPCCIFHGVPWRRAAPISLVAAWCGPGGARCAWRARDMQ